jgi:hypothetical protein
MLTVSDITATARLKKDVRTGALAAAVVATIVALPLPFIAVPMFYATYRMNRGTVWAGVVSLVLTGMVALFFGAVFISQREAIVTGGTGETALFLAFASATLLTPIMLVAFGLAALKKLQRQFLAGEVWPKQRHTIVTPWRSRAFTWMTIGILAALGFVASVILAYWIGFELLSGWKEGLLALSLLPALYWTMKRLRRIERWTRRHMAASVAELRRADTRPAVLLLRSFKDDELTVQPMPRFNLWTVFDADETKAGRDFTLEEAIATVLGEYGPVIAIGEPGRALHPLGAARENVADEDWQDAVDRHIVDAAWIVAIAATSEGLLWELQRILERGAARKLLLVFPPVSKANLALRWERLQPLVGHLASEKELKKAPTAGLLVMRLNDRPPSIKLYSCDEKTQNALDTAMRVALADSV